MGSILTKELVILLCLKIISDITIITPSQWYLIDVLNSDDDHIDMPNLIKMVKLAKNPHYDINFIHFHLFVNCRLSLVSLRRNFIFWTHCPASNSLASCGQCFCNITGLSIHFLVVVVVVWSIWGCVWDGVGVVLCWKAPYHMSVWREEWALCSWTVTRYKNTFLVGKRRSGSLSKKEIVSLMVKSLCFFSPTASDAVRRVFVPRDRLAPKDLFWPFLLCILIWANEKAIPSLRQSHSAVRHEGPSLTLGLKKGDWV